MATEYEGRTEIRYPLTMAIKAFQLLIDQTHTIESRPRVTGVSTEGGPGGSPRFKVTVEPQEKGPTLPEAGQEASR